MNEQGKEKFGAELPSHQTKTSNSRPEHPSPHDLDHESLHLVADSTDLSGEVASLVGGDAGGNHGAGDTSGTAQGELAGDINVTNPHTLVSAIPDR